MLDILASLEVPVQGMIADCWTVEELRQKYRTMLARQLKDWNSREEYFNKMVMSAKQKVVNRLMKVFNWIEIVGGQGTGAC